MNKAIAILIVLLLTINSNGQTLDKNSLIGLPKATTNELEALQNLTDTESRPELGSLAFDTDKDRVMQYTNSGWQEMLTSGNVYPGSFIISNNSSLSIIDVPFRPKYILFKAYANIETFNLNSDNAVGNNDPGINNSFGSMEGYARDNNGSIEQQVIYLGASGNSINDISRYASSSNCIGLRYSNQNGDNLGILSATLASFNSNGFTLNIIKTSNASAENVVVL